ncbi:hypothetical protein V1525DRAFT_434064 [Lipomyces kononenkoae]|uniref:Uncharacterized protein n=1 Tax=Lipomyces kononenkoae TaxID=34357 RepID=A0ACC3SWR7_LIPKO
MTAQSGQMRFPFQFVCRVCNLFFVDCDANTRALFSRLTVLVMLAYALEAAWTRAFAIARNRCLCRGYNRHAQAHTDFCLRTDCDLWTRTAANYTRNGRWRGTAGWRSGGNTLTKTLCRSRRTHHGRCTCRSRATRCVVSNNARMTRGKVCVVRQRPPQVSVWEHVEPVGHGLPPNVLVIFDGGGGRVVEGIPSAINNEGKSSRPTNFNFMMSKLDFTTTDTVKVEDGLKLAILCYPRVYTYFISQRITKRNPMIQSHMSHWLR